MKLIPSFRGITVGARKARRGAGARRGVTLLLAAFGMSAVLFIPPTSAAFKSTAWTKSGDVVTDVWQKGGQTVTVELPEPPAVQEVYYMSLSRTGLFRATDGRLYTVGDRAQIPMPGIIEEPPGVTFVNIAGLSNGFIALGSDGEIYGWGYDYKGSFASGTLSWYLGTSRFVETPEKLPKPPGVSSFTLIAVGTNDFSGDTFSFAVDNSGQLWGWGGLIAGGVFGPNTFGVRSTMVNVPLPQGMRIKQLAPGGRHVAALSQDGRIYTWGSQYRSADPEQGTPEWHLGSLGRGSDDPKDDPTPGLIAQPEGANSELRFMKVVSQGSNSYALGADGKVYAWGPGYVGQLGPTLSLIDGNARSNKAVPTVAPNGEKFKDISPGLDAVIATTTSGKVYSWGDRVSIGREASAGVPPHRGDSSPGLLKLSADDSVTIQKVSYVGSNLSGSPTALLGSDGSWYGMYTRFSNFSPNWIHYHRGVHDTPADWPGPGAWVGQPLRILKPKVSITGVDFGGEVVDVSNLTQIPGTRKWKFTAPDRPANAELTVKWNLYDGPQPPVTTYQITP